MKRSIVTLYLVFGFGLAKLQVDILWKDTNVILEEKLTTDSTYEYTGYAKELKYKEIYYLLTASSETLQEVMGDLNFFEEMANKEEGVIEHRALNQVASRKTKSVFIFFDKDLGFSILQHHELKKLNKMVNKQAERRGVTLTNQLA